MLSDSNFDSVAFGALIKELGELVSAMKESRSPIFRSVTLSDTKPWTAHYFNRKHLYLYSSAAVTLSVEDLGSLSILANTLTFFPFDQGVRVLSTSAGIPYTFLLLATDELLPLGANVSATVSGSVTVSNTNPNGQNIMANSSPVTIASDQPSEIAVGTDDGITAASTRGMMVGGVTGGGRYERLQIDSSSGGLKSLGIPQSSSIEASTTLTAAAAGSITLPGTAGAFTWIRGLCISSASAAAEVSGVVTITGLANTLSFEYVIPTTRGGLLFIDFGTDGIASSAFNTGLVIHFPAITGGSATALAAWGYQY